ncbi:hypothetical protein [Micromonospora cremea]|nr:hypothetical protein [Micromonospora cremea]
MDDDEWPHRPAPAVPDREAAVAGRPVPPLTGPVRHRMALG